MFFVIGGAPLITIRSDRKVRARERDHCKMVAIPTFDEEDAKRPSRERECLVAEQSRLVNRMKSALVRLGIRGFNPKLKCALEHLKKLRTPEGGALPPNTLAELKRDLERRAFICDQIRKIEEERTERLKRAPNTGPNIMVRLLARVRRDRNRDCGSVGSRDTSAWIA
jgi:transposase